MKGSNPITKFHAIARDYQKDGIFSLQLGCFLVVVPFTVQNITELLQRKGLKTANRFSKVVRDIHTKVQSF